jgi:hypothetical protein
MHFCFSLALASGSGSKLELRKALSKFSSEV